jgi:hypothetical protein
MIQQYQTKFYNHDRHERGDCLRACLSSITELPIDCFEHKTWIGDYFDKMEPLGFSYVGSTISISGIGQCEGVDGLFIAFGETDRNVCLHAVVINSNGDLIHDPHPEGNGLTKISGIFLIERTKNTR